MTGGSNLETGLDGVLHCPINISYKITFNMGFIKFRLSHKSQFCMEVHAQINGKLSVGWGQGMASIVWVLWALVCLLGCMQISVIKLHLPPVPPPLGNAIQEVYLLLPDLE